MFQKSLTRREFLKALGLSIAVGALPRAFGYAATCPVMPIKGAITHFMSGSYLDIQFNKNPDIHKNPALEKTITDMSLKPFKPEGFPYSGANSANWLFVFDFGCQPSGPLTIKLSNKVGKKTGTVLEHFAGNRYAAVFHALDYQALLDLFGDGAQGQIILTLTDGKGATLWKSGVLKTYRPRNGSGNGGGG